MAKRTKNILTTMSTAELKRMLATKQKIEKLEAARDKLTADLAKVDKEIEKLLGGGTARAIRKKAAKKKTAKKTVRRKAGTKKKVVAKKAGRKIAKRPVRRTTRKRAAATPKLEDVVIQVLRAGGGKMKFPEIRDTITSKKLYKSKSKNFDNVLRRTISTAKGIKRVTRGVYSAK